MEVDDDRSGKDEVGANWQYLKVDGLSILGSSLSELPTSSCPNSPRLTRTSPRMKRTSNCSSYNSLTSKNSNSTPRQNDKIKQINPYLKNESPLPKDSKNSNCTRKSNITTANITPVINTTLNNTQRERIPEKRKNSFNNFISSRPPLNPQR